MNNLNVLRSVFLMAVALLFGVTASRYQLGTFGKMGPGMFPLLVSCMLFSIGVMSLVRSWFVPAVAVDMKVKNIAVILLSLCGFIVISQHINMTAGIVFLVFCSSYAGSNFNMVRNFKICAGLLVVALIFKNLLGLNLPLF
jgi:hypothetical protein